MSLRGITRTFYRNDGSGKSADSLTITPPQPNNAHMPCLLINQPKLKADRLLVLTDVAAVICDYGTPDARPIHVIDTVALSAMAFPAGSMGPKVEACIRFVSASGQPAAIGALADAAAILAGRAGTTINVGGSAGGRR